MTDTRERLKVLVERYCQGVSPEGQARIRDFADWLVARGVSVSEDAPSEPVQVFESAYAAHSKTTVEQLHQFGRFAIRCDCGDVTCEGFQMAHASDFDGTTPSGSEPRTVLARWLRAVRWATESGECKACEAETCRGAPHAESCPFRAVDAQEEGLKTSTNEVRCDDCERVIPLQLSGSPALYLTLRGQGVHKKADFCDVRCFVRWAASFEELSKVITRAARSVLEVTP